MSQTNDISISKQAAEKINNIISSEKKDLMLKISVLGGGCAGFSYKFDLVDNSEQGDIIIEEHGAKVIIDEVSVPYICLLYTSPSPRDLSTSRMPSSA